MLVNYIPVNVLNLPIVSKDKVIEDNVLLRPGINEISKKVWERVKNLPKVKRFLKEEKIIIESEADATEDTYILAKMDVREAGPIVKKTWDLDLLETWLGCENRSGVVRAINAQIKEIEERTTRKKED